MLDVSKLTAVVFLKSQPAALSVDPTSCFPVTLILKWSIEQYLFWEGLFYVFVCILRARVCVLIDLQYVT